MSSIKKRAQLKNAFVVIACMLTFEVFAQTTISGVVNGKDGLSIPSANVIILKASDSTMVKGMVSNVEGKYIFDNVLSGKYVIVSSMIGFRKYYSAPFEVGTEPVRLQAIMLEELATELKEVTVVADKPLFEQQIDKLVVNVENSITAAGGTALEVLERSPGITVNKQSNALSLVGKQGVLIMINGKIQRLPMEAIIQQLGGMNANTIEKIEIINNPSSKYDAQGDAGIINIIMKKSMDMGTNGSYTMSLGYGWYEKPSASVRINHRGAKGNIFADYSVNYNRLWQRFSFDWYNANQGQQTNSVSNRYSEVLISRATIGAELNITSKTIVGVLVSGFDDKWTMDARNNSDISFNNSPYSNIKLNDIETNHWKHLMGNFNVRHALKNGSISLDADYLYYHDDNPHNYKNVYHYFHNDSIALEEIKIAKSTPINMSVVKADFEKTINKVKLESGLKGTVSRLSNKVSVEEKREGDWVTNEDFTQDYDMKDDVWAAYTNLFITLSDKTKLQTGLRAESTDMEIKNQNQEKIFDLAYVSLFPSAFITHKIGKDQTLQLSYGRRITRPSYNDIAPFVVFIDPYTYFSGNPQLKPTITNNVIATFTHKQIIATLKYSQDKDYIARFQVRVNPENNKSYYFSSNMDNVKSLSLSLSFPVDITKWWEIQNNVLGLHQQLITNYTGQDISLKLNSGQINSTHTFTLGRGFTSEITASYWTPSLFGVSKVSGFGQVTAGIQKKLDKNRGTFRVNISDIFWTNVIRFGMNNESLNLHQNGVLRFEPRIIRISYSRNFGRTSVKGGRSITGSEAEQGRVK